MLTKYIVELNNNPSFWYFVSFILFIIIFLRPILKLCNDLICDEQNRFAKKLADAQTVLNQAQSNLRSAEIKTYDLTQDINEIRNKTDQQVTRLQEKMYQQIEEYKAYNQTLLQQKLINFETEEMQKLKNIYIKNLVRRITNDINSKIDESTDQKIRHHTIDTLMN